jgi:hypothetical protein
MNSRIGQYSRRFLSKGSRINPSVKGPLAFYQFNAPQQAPQHPSSRHLEESWGVERVGKDDQRAHFRCLEVKSCSQPAIHYSAMAFRSVAVHNGH